MDMVAVKIIYSKIQKLLFYMIPEKWDRIYLYASLYEHLGNLQTGEMFFYYFPKGILKKKPINVYEIPSRFSLDEEPYLKLVNELYETIKELKKFKNNKWNHITIKLENFKFIVEYYNDKLNSKYSNLENHVIWTYENLNLPIEGYTKHEREVIFKYLKEDKKDIKKIVYSEAMYRKPIKNIVDYDRDELPSYIKEKALEEVEEKIKNQILHF